MRRLPAALPLTVTCAALLAGVLVLSAPTQAQSGPSPFPATNTARAVAPFPATNTPRAIATSTPLPTATASPPTFTPEGQGGATWTPPPADPAAQIADHYYMQRPISDDFANYIAWTYPYGNTSGGHLQVHHGVDIVNPTGTPVLAAADGVVLFAGDDLTTLIGLANNYYGNAVIIQHGFLDASGAAVYTLYGHLDTVTVAPGQSVAAGDEIGTVGARGVALGAHLHFEVRVGNPYDFNSTRNPALWIRPYFGYGTLAGPITDAAGAPLYGATLIVEPTGGTTGPVRYAFSYQDDSVHGDSAFNEQWVLGDLPEGYYTVTVSDGGRVRFRETAYVDAGRTTWVDVRLDG